MKLSRNKPIIIHQAFHRSIEDVWKVITEVDHMKKWFFAELTDFKAKSGFKTGFLIKHEGKQFYHLWKIVEVIPFKKIVYDWRYREYKGKGEVTFELFSEDRKTILQLTNIGLHTFPDNIEEFKVENCYNGWKYFINERLVTYLNNS